MRLVGNTGRLGTEARAPLFDLVSGAFECLDHNLAKQLVWVAGADYEVVNVLAASRADIRVFDSLQAIEDLIVASDIVITKGNRGTVYDAASLGVPSISVSFGLNPIDDMHLTRIRSNTSFNYGAITCAELASVLFETFRTDRKAVSPLNYHENGGEAAAQNLAKELLRLGVL
jgi:hypothetical protein